MGAAAMGEISEGNTQMAILNHVLDLHPTHLTREQLVRQLGPNPDVFPERDLILQGINVLQKVELLGENGEFIVPMPAALYFRMLSEWDL
jgi:hypothetical protein